MKSLGKLPGDLRSEALGINEKGRSWDYPEEGVRFPGIPVAKRQAN